jgi:hypothetical protein
LRSIRSSSRGRTSERGFALIAALTLAVLYFALMELILIDSSRALAEAQRFRARIMAATMAEDAAELAALNMRGKTSALVDISEDDRVMRAEYRRAGENFEIVARATSIGAMRQSAGVRVQGRMTESGVIKIDYTMHEQ